MKLFVITAIIFSWLSVTAQAQESSSKLEKIASCGPNTLYRRFAKTPEVLPGGEAVHVRAPGADIDQVASDRIVAGDIYIFKFERWSGEQSFPGGRNEALAFFRYHCSMPGRGEYPAVVEQGK